MSPIKPYKFIWFEATNVNKPYKFIGAGALQDKGFVWGSPPRQGIVLKVERAIGTGPIVHKHASQQLRLLVRFPSKLRCILLIRPHLGLSKHVRICALSRGRGLGLGYGLGFGAILGW